MGCRDGFTPPNDKEIMEILDLLNESEFDELRLEMTGIKLVFSKNAIDSPNQTVEKIQSPVLSEQITPMDNDKERARDMGDSEELGRIEEEGLVPIKAPLLGIFAELPNQGPLPSSRWETM